ncbi:MAG: hypothetical protein ILA12_10245, partial [Butyrivibrio sp.]|nr:hypothetical protein [Butyrivibrio sp.]
MGFFSELKSDLSQAVNTLMPEDKPEAEGLDNKATENKEPVDIDSMLNRLDDIKLEDTADKAEDNVNEKLDKAVKETPAQVKEPVAEEPVKEPEETASEEDVLEEKIEEQTMEEIAVSEPKNALEAINPAHIDKYV